MERHRLTTALAAFAAAAMLGAAVATAGSAGMRATELSSNWAGYVVTGLGSTTTKASGTTQYKTVTATWKQPRAKCPDSGESSALAIWVGLGGYSTTATMVEQAGTSADCEDGKATYYAWYELLPDPPVIAKSFKVMPGDTITASVVVTGSNVLFWMKNRTRHTVLSKRLRAEDLDLSSAEWITEAPVECMSDTNCRQAPLANFGAVKFSRVATLATVGGVDQGGTITSPYWQSTALRLLPDAAQRYFGGVATGEDSTLGIAGAKPFGLLADGSSFTVSWVARPKA